MHVTQSDIARKAGVHATTVSLALRSHPSIPLATRERIRALADSMGYKPDPALRALMAYRSRISTHRTTTTLAYVTNWDTRWGWRNSPAHAQFFEGATSKANELGFALEHFWLSEPGLTHHRLNDILVARGIRGVLIASQLDPFDHPVAFDWSQFGAIKIDVLPSRLRLNHVTNNQCAIAQMAMRQVLAFGYGRIGVVMPRWWDDVVDRAWSAGFLSVQARLPDENRVPMLLYGDNHGSGMPRVADKVVTKNALSDWLRRHEPEVVISYAPFVLPQLAALGVRVPDDVAFADIFLEDTSGTIAGVRQNCRRVGEVALESLGGLLAQNVTGLPTIPSSTLIEGTWFTGVSLPDRSKDNDLVLDQSSRREKYNSAASRSCAI
jgi:LacI family transcriptional regulator